MKRVEHIPDVLWPLVIVQKVGWSFHLYLMALPGIIAGFVIPGGIATAILVLHDYILGMTLFHSAKSSWRIFLVVFNLFGVLFGVIARQGWNCL